jgi:hypothetical protein
MMTPELAQLLNELLKASPYALLFVGGFFLFYFMHRKFVAGYEKLYSKSIEEIRMSYKEAFDRVTDILRTRN